MARGLWLGKGMEHSLLQKPHHDGSPLYVQAPEDVGDYRLGDTVTLRVWVPKGNGIESVELRSVRDGEMELHPAHIEEELEHGSWWSVDAELANPTLSYRFQLHGTNGLQVLNAQGLWNRDVPDDSDFKITAFASPPSWLQEAVVYQIFPDRFETTGTYRDPVPTWAIDTAWDEPVVDERGIAGRQFYGGDLDGIRHRLDYLESLGVNVLYLTPIFPARSNHRYDAASFDVIDPHLGGEEALRALADAAHQRGMRVIGDFTTNHTGSHHDWFLTASQDKESSERDFYYWNEDGSYVGWLGHASLPKLNYTNPQVRQQLFIDPQSPLRRWLEAGLDGWRIDVANMTGRSGSDDFTHDVARAVREGATQQRPDSYLVAEHFFDYTKDLPGDGWHGVMNYQGFTFPLWAWLRDPNAQPLPKTRVLPQLSGQTMAQTIDDFTARVPWANRVASLNILESHDTARILTLLEGDQDKLAVAVAFLMTMPGVPMVEYGGEVGMEGKTGEDGRRPMPWQDLEATDFPIRSLYEELIALRKSSSALQQGGLRWIHLGEDSVVFLRESPEETALVHLARAAHDPIRLDLKALPGAQEAQHRWGQPAEVSDEQLVLEARGPAVTVLTWDREGVSS